MQAFTVSDDHELQESVWHKLPSWQRDNARAIRQALTEGEVPATDRRVRFVGLETYEAEGGIVRRDLFDPENGGSILDPALLDSLVLRKLDAVAEDVRAEGWKWVEVRPYFDRSDRLAFDAGGTVEAALPDDIRVEADALTAEYDELCDNDEGEAAERLHEVERRLDEIEDMARIWPDDLKTRAGAIVYLSHDGADIERGLIRAEDAVAQEEGTESGDVPEAKARSLYPASLIEDLSAQKTAALRVATARSPDIALALMVHTLACNAFYRHEDGVLKLRLVECNLDRLMQDYDAALAVVALEAERERVRAMLPKDQSALWDWCLNAGRETLLDVLAVAIAFGVDAVESRNDPNRDGVRHGKALAAALGLDIADWYSPTAAGYFSRIGKATILADLESIRQAAPAPAWLKLKKGDLAALAEREASGSRWVPAPLQ